MPDPKKRKRVKSDKDSVVRKKNKKYNVSVSKKTRMSEKDGRMQARREEEFKQDIKKAGGLHKYLKKTKAARKSMKKNPPRKAY